jgi:hypothetical protein
MFWAILGQFFHKLIWSADLLSKEQCSNLDKSFSRRPKDDESSGQDGRPQPPDGSSCSCCRCWAKYIIFNNNKKLDIYFSQTHFNIADKS